MTTHLVIGDQHAHYQYSNERADWLSRLIIDVQPEVVINIGDGADMPSLSGYERGKKSFQGRTYKADIEAHLDFQGRLWGPIYKRKKRLPRRVYLIGNHEFRISRAINIQPELEGAIGLEDLRLSDFYDTVVDYNGNLPGSIELDGITYAHFLPSGVSGRPISGDRGAYHLLAKRFSSCTVGHSHLLDHCYRTTINGRGLQGLVVGCYQDFDSDWAGESNKFWWRGVVVKRNVQDGNYDPEFISLDAMRREYG